MNDDERMSMDVVDLVRRLIEERDEHAAAITRINEKLAKLREIINMPEVVIDAGKKPEPVSLHQVWNEHTDRHRLTNVEGLPQHVYETRILAALAAQEPLTLNELHALKLGPKQSLAKTLLNLSQRHLVSVTRGFNQGPGKPPYLYRRSNALLTPEEVPSANADPG